MAATNRPGQLLALGAAPVAIGSLSLHGHRVPPLARTSRRDGLASLDRGATFRSCDPVAQDALAATISAVDGCLGEVVVPAASISDDRPSTSRIVRSAQQRHMSDVLASRVEAQMIDGHTRRDRLHQRRVDGSVRHRRAVPEGGYAVAPGVDVSEPRPTRLVPAGHVDPLQDLLDRVRWASHHFPKSTGGR